MKKILSFFCALLISVMTFASVQDTISNWNALFKTSYSGSISGIKKNEWSLSGTTAKGNTFAMTNGTSTNGYVKDSEVRMYNGYTVTITAPADQVILGMEATQGDKVIKGLTANVGTLTIGGKGATMSWTGDAASVVLSVSETTSFGQLIITYGTLSSVATPTFTPAEPEFIGSVDVTLASATEGASILYSLDGSTPSIAYTGAITLTATTTVKAVAVLNDNTSNEATKTYKMIPSYANLDALVAAGEPTTNGTKVNVTFENVPIDSFYVTKGGSTNGVYVTAGGRAIEIYCLNVPETWEQSGKISGTLTCPWKNYNGTWELCPSDWNGITYTAPVVGPPTKDYVMTTTSVEVEDVSAPTYSEYNLTIMATGVYGDTEYCYEIDATIDPDEASIAGTFTYNEGTLSPLTAVMWIKCATGAMSKTRYLEEGSTLTITSKGNNKYGLTGKLICADRKDGEITTILNYNFDTEFEFEFAPEVPATQYGIKYYCPTNPDDGVYRHIYSTDCADVFGDGTMSYDPEKKELTLNNYKVDLNGAQSAYPIVNESIGGLKIILKGENELISGTSTALRLYATTTLTGGGKLTATAIGTISDGIYISGGGDLTIDSCEVVANTAYGIEGSGGTLTITNGAKVTATGATSGSITGWGSIVLGEGIQILSPAGAQIADGSVQDAGGNLLKSEVVIGKYVPRTLAEAVEGKTIRRAVADNDGVFVLAVDADKAPVLVKSDFEGNILTHFATDFCTAGSPNAKFVLSDIALTVDGVLIGCNADSTLVDPSTDPNNGSIKVYKWEADGTGAVLFTFNAYIYADASWTAAFAGETMTYHGTLADGQMILSGVSATGANKGRMREIILNITDGAVASKYYNKPTGNAADAPMISTVYGNNMQYNAGGDTYQVLVSGSLIAPQLLQLVAGETNNGVIAAQMAADYTGINGFSFATVEEAKWMLVPANDGVKVLNVTDGLDQAAVLHELAAAELTPAYKYAALVTVEGENKVMLLRDANITMLDISAPVEPVYALNPYAFGVSASAEGDVVTINYSLNVDAEKVTAQVFNGETLVGEMPLQGITKGAHSEDVDLATLELTEGKYSLKVSVEGVVHEFTTYADSTITFNNRYHATVDANPMSPNFGNIYGACRYDKIGIYRITPDYTYLNTEPAMLGLSSWGSVQRGAVAPNGEMWFSTWGDSNSGIYRYDPSVKADSCTQFFIGTRAATGLITNNGQEVGCSTPGIAIYSAGKDSKLYLIGEDFTGGSTKGSLAIYNIGQEDGSIVTSWDKAPSAHHNTLTDKDGTNFAMAATPYGVWICQNRAAGANIAGARSLQFIGNDGVQRYLSTDAELINGSYGAGIVTNATFDKLWMVNGNGNILQLSIAWAGEGEAMTPSLTLDATYETPFGAIAQMTFDFAGNIVAVGGTGNTPYSNNASVLRLAVFSLPATEAPVAATPVVGFEYEVVGMRGAYLVGGEGADFASLYAACDSVNKAVLAGNLTGDVELLIAADLVEPVNIGLFNTTDHTITIRPDQDADRTVLFTQGTDNEGPSGGFVIGCDMGITFTGIATKNIVIDGFAEDGDTRRLTFTTTDGFGSKAGPIVFYGDVTNSAIQNCIVTNTIHHTSTSAYAITLRTERSTDKCPVGVIIENNEIEVLVADNGQGIFLNGSQAATAKVGAPKNTVVRNNVITAATRGIFLYGANGLIVEGNTIRVRQHAGGRLSHGIMGNSQTGVITVRGNIFDELTTVNTTSGDYGIQAITASGGADVWMIENNYFGGFDAGTACAGQPTKICGVRMGDSCVVRHNTFEMPVLSNTPSTTLLTNAPITLLYYAGSLNYVVENNILISHETAANNSLVRGTISSNSKGNLFWLDETTPTNAVVMDAGTPAATFADLDPAIQAANINEKVELVDTYKLADEYIGKKVLGVAALADVTVDIEGQERHTPLTYVGCYEASDLNSGGTDLEKIQAEDGAAHKVLYRGHMYIIRDGKMFNVSGMKVR